MKLQMNFWLWQNKKDIKGLIKMGNERVVEARLRDEFFGIKINHKIW